MPEGRDEIAAPADAEVARVASKWTDAQAGERYERIRWRSRRERDPALVARLLVRHAGDARRVLDVPAGSGRLVDAIGAPRWFGCDASGAMLAAAPHDAATRAVRGLAQRLPFVDGAFDAVVCCRLLHHLATSDARRAVLSEAARVARVVVMVSFWDSASWPAVRRRWLGGAPDRGGRGALPRKELAADAAACGLEVVAFAADRRFASPQTFAVLRHSARS